MVIEINKITSIAGLSRTNTKDTVSYVCYKNADILNLVCSLNLLAIAFTMVSKYSTWFATEHQC